MTVALGTSVESSDTSVVFKDVPDQLEEVFSHYRPMGLIKDRLEPIQTRGFRNLSSKMNVGFIQNSRKATLQNKRGIVSITFKEILIKVCCWSFQRIGIMNPVPSKVLESIDMVMPSPNGSEKFSVSVTLREREDDEL